MTADELKAILTGTSEALQLALPLLGTPELSPVLPIAAQLANSLVDLLSTHASKVTTSQVAAVDAQVDALEKAKVGS